ncbi:OTU-domain-containing protein [Hysterangium stoloniferum]|nr:OTU-domain-containing protein [Hysterangium stoloniferum]
MVPIRLRHPKGVTTIQVDIENENVKVSDLQQAIFSATEIPPSLQSLKAGYPPQPLTAIPQLPLSSLGLKRGEQLLVTQASGGGISHAPQSTVTSPSPGLNPPNISSQQPITQHRKQGLGDEYVQTDGGVLVHRVVPDDNSCLFSSIGVVFEQDMGASARLRQLAADTIRKDPETYSEVMLGRPREDYINTILNPQSWGGAIELSIFAAHYRTEISSIDVETGRVDRFGEGSGYANRAILLYSGIHYDATSFAPTHGAPLDFHQTVFPVRNQVVLTGGQELAAKLRIQKKFTNTATFLLKCEICGKGLKGEKEARAHAGETGHAEFGEYS